METRLTGTAVSRWIRSALVLAFVTFLAPFAAAQIGGNRAGASQETPVQGRAPDRADGLAGTYADGRVTVLLIGGSGRYTGAFAIGSQLYPLTARAQTQPQAPTKATGGLAGSFEAGGKSFAFTGVVRDDVLTLRSGGAELQLRRKPALRLSGNPLAGGSVSAAAQVAVLKPGFKLHKHSLGFSLQVPETWQVTEAPGGLLLTPPDVKQEAWGPSESFVVTGAQAEGVESPSDPRVQQYIQGALAQTLGSELRAVGSVESFQAGPRTAAAMTWKGTFPNGNRFRTRAYVVMIAGYGVSLSYVGPTLQLKRRDAVLREIVATFASDAPAPQASGPVATSGGADARLVGRWYRSVYRRSALPGGINTSFHQTMLLAPDGKLSWVDQTVLTGSQPAGQASSGWTFSGIPESSVNRGTWSAKGNTVRMNWSGGGAVYTVHVQGAQGRREMLLTPQAGGEKELWTEYAN